jgi:hypothetical protein
LLLCGSCSSIMCLAGSLNTQVRRGFVILKNKKMRAHVYLGI